MGRVDWPDSTGAHSLASVHRIFRANCKLAAIGNPARYSRISRSVQLPKRLDLTPKVGILAIDSRYRELSIKEGKKKTLLRNGSRSRTGATMRVHCGMSLQIMTIAIN